MQEDTHFLDTAKVASYAKNYNHVIFMDEAVSDSSYYRSSILTLKTASPDDSIEIIFNTEGGQCYTASVFIAAMRQCQAKITGNLSGLCASAGTMVALNCDDWIIGDDLVFMCHNASHGGYNSAEKLKDQMDFYNKWTADIARRDYEGFLTEAEIESMITNGKEYWFNAEDTAKRLSSYKEYHLEKHNKSVEDEFLSQCDEEDALVEQALADLNIPEEERKVFDKINSKLEEYFSQVGDTGEGGVLQGNSKEVVKFSFQKEDSLEPISTETVMVVDKEGNDYALFTYTKGEGDVGELELLDEDSTSFIINSEFLTDLPVSELKSLCKDLGIKFSHNSKDTTLAKNIVAYFEGLIK